MKATIRERVAGDKLPHAVPPAYRDELRKAMKDIAETTETRPDGPYTLLLFAHAPRDVVRSPPVRKALRRLGTPAPGGLLAVGTVFTVEALELLREAGAKVIALRKARWTDESARQRQLSPGPLDPAPQDGPEHDEAPDDAGTAADGARDPQDKDGLLDAYAATDYHVEGLPSPLRVGEPNAELADFLAGHGAASLAILTAYNPRSEALSLAENAQRQGALRTALSERGLRFVDAEGRSRGGEPRPPEPLLCVFDAPPGLLHRLLEAFEQNALVHARAGAAPRLMLLPDFERELEQEE